jgi:hypothetical protein
MSATGQYQTAAGSGPSSFTGPIFTSVDYGVSWRQVESLRYWSCVSVSANGQYQLAGQYGGSHYRSIDYGSNWTQVNNLSGIFNSISMSSNGQYINSVNNSGYIYTSVTPYGPSSFSSIVGDVSMNANLYTLGRTIHQGDVSLNTRLFVAGDVSMNSRLFVGSSITLASNQINAIRFGVASSATNATVTVNFGYTFPSVPIVTCTVIYSGAAYPSVSALITSTTTTNFQYNVFFTGGSHSEQYCTVNWIAIC